MNTEIITEQQALEAVCQEFASSPFIAVDTEFVRERTYYAQLALIQIATADRAVCIDPLALQDLSPIKVLFATPDITKVFHACGQDMEIFYYLFDELPHPIYDTQIAATLLGQGEQVSYANLVKKMLDVDLDKSHSRTNWLHRPLSAAQLHYAADDVHYLARLFPRQRQALEEQGRLQWLDEEFQALTETARYRPAPEKMWRRVKGFNRLRGQQLAILQALAAWREERAIRIDQPRRRVISDDLLLNIARLRPKDKDALSRLSGIPPKVLERQGETIINLVKEACQRPQEAWPTLSTPQRLETAQEAQVDALNAIVKLYSAKHNLSPNSLTSRKELERLVAGERELAILSGWRRHHGGDQLVAFLEGKTALKADGNRLRLIEN